MQSAGQYGVAEVPQFMVGRLTNAHMYAHSHEMTLSPASTHGHPGHHSQHLHAQQQQQQQQLLQLHHAQQHSQHPAHQTHAALAQHQAHQTSQHSQHSQHSHHSQHAQHTQHVQHAPHAQHQMQQAQHQLQLSPHHQIPPHQQAQQQMVQPLGLGNADSPEEHSPIDSRQSPPTSFTKQMAAARGESIGHELALGQDDDGMELGDEGRSTGGGNRWPRQETLALIKIRSELDALFRDSGLKQPLWEEVARKLAELGYSRNAKKCKEKFENIYKYYKKTKDGKAGRQDGKNYRFFSQLEALYSGQHASAQVEGGATLLLTGGHEVASGGTDVILADRPIEQHSEGAVPLSENSEDDYDEPAADGDEQEGSKKRKRKEGKEGSLKIEVFEGLVKKLINKQEEMQKRFLDSMEMRERERLLREETWRKQEMARLQREHEIRAQEHNLTVTRDAALVAFLQKYTGQTLQLPQVTPPIPTPTIAPTPTAAPSSAVVAVVEAEHTLALAPAPPSVSAAQTLQLAETPQEEMDKDAASDPNSKRWPKPEVQNLIRLRSSMETKFQEAGPKLPLWEEISTSMSFLGYNRNAKRCKEKWENINKYFRKTKESNKKRPENAKTCPYFHQLDALYRSGELVTPVSKMKILGECSEEVLEHQGGQDNGDDSGQVQAEGMMALMRDSATATSNGAAGHFFSSPENCSSNERGGSNKVKAWDSS